MQLSAPAAAPVRRARFELSPPAASSHAPPLRPPGALNNSQAQLLARFHAAKSERQRLMRERDAGRAAALVTSAGAPAKAPASVAPAWAATVGLAAVAVAHAAPDPTCTKGFVDQFPLPAQWGHVLPPPA